MQCQERETPRTSRAELRAELPPLTLTTAAAVFVCTCWDSKSVHLPVCLSVCHCNCRQVVFPSVPSKLCLNLLASGSVHLLLSGTSVCVSLFVCHCHGPVLSACDSWTFQLADTKERCSFLPRRFMITRGPRPTAMPSVFVWSGAQACLSLSLSIKGVGAFGVTVAQGMA